MIQDSPDRTQLAEELLLLKCSELLSLIHSQLALLIDLQRSLLRKLDLVAKAIEDETESDTPE